MVSERGTFWRTVGHGVNCSSEESEVEDEVVSRALPNENGVTWGSGIVRGISSTKLDPRREMKAVETESPHLVVGKA